MSDRRASVYLLTLSAAALVAVAGLTALQVLESRRAAGQEALAATRARLAAVSGVDLAAYWLSSDSDWRFRMTSGYWASISLADGTTIDFAGLDPVDGDFSDDLRDPVRLLARARCGEAVACVAVTLETVTEALPVLSASLYSDSGVKTGGGDDLTVAGGPLMCRGIVDNDALVIGDVEASLVKRPDLVTGSVTRLQATPVFPDQGALSSYLAAATWLPQADRIEDVVLTPGFSSLGTANPAGIYAMDCQGHDIDIKHCRIKGTLILLNVHHAEIKERVLLEHNNYAGPLLVVVGEELKVNTKTDALSEADRGVNFNPPGAPFEGMTDLDTEDLYPNRVDGLVHVTGCLRLDETPSLSGCWLAQGAVELGEPVTIMHDSELEENAPEGYRNPAALRIQPGSWQRITSDEFDAAVAP